MSAPSKRSVYVLCLLIRQSLLAPRQRALTKTVIGVFCHSGDMRQASRAYDDFYFSFNQIEHYNNMFGPHQLWNVPCTHFRPVWGCYNPILRHTLRARFQWHASVPPGRKIRFSGRGSLLFALSEMLQTSPAIMESILHCRRVDIFQTPKSRWCPSSLFTC